MAQTDRLPNIGKWQEKYSFESVRRLALTLVTKENGDVNTLTASNGQIQLTTLQGLFNKHRYDSDVKEKIVVTPRVYQYKPTPEDGTVYDNNDGYRRKTRDGDLNATFIIEEPNPDIVRQFKELENISFATYFIDEEGRLGGKVNGTTITPLELEVDVKPWKQHDYEDTGKMMATLRFKNPNDMNEFDYVQIVDSNGDNANVASEVQFFSLIDCTMTVSNPAITGCTVVINQDRYTKGGLTTPMVGALLGNFTYYLSTDLTTPIPATGAAESPDGTYAPLATLTTGLTYYLRLTYDGYDAIQGTVVVP